MRLSPSPDPLFAGVDNLTLDNRDFDPTRDDIQRICRFFAIGKLLHFEKEKGTIVSHSNFFVFVATTQGEFALKFYPSDTAPLIANEYAVNRILVHHHFPTPAMYAGIGGQPSLASNGLLAACYFYINGVPVWKHIKDKTTFPRINAALLSLKNILSSTHKHIPFLKQKSLVKTINSLARESRAMAPYDQKETIDRSLLDACRTYQHHRSLFTRQWLHSDAILNNFLIYKKTIHTLDLAHIREDYALSDLASLVISCVFFDLPFKEIKALVKDYFTRHKTDPDPFVLNTLVKTKLVREFLRNLQRERSVGISADPPAHLRSYMFHLSARKKTIAALLKKMNATPRFIV